MRDLWLRIRGYGALALAALAILGLPVLLIWWITGGPFGWGHLLGGLAIGLGIFALLALIFAWAIGQAAKR